MDGGPRARVVGAFDSGYGGGSQSMVRHRPGRPTFLGAHRVAVAVAGLLVLLVVIPAVHAQMVARKNLAQLIDEAEQIFVGTVTAAQSSQPPGSLIVTDLTFAVDRVLKGEVLDPFVLRHAGGTVDGVTLSVGGAPEFVVDGRYLVFARGNGRSGIPLVGGAQGLFQVVALPDRAVDVVRTARGGPLTNATVLSLPAPPAAARGAPAGPLTLAVFLEAIAGALAR